MKEILLSENQLIEIINNLANKLNEYYKDTSKPVILVSVLKGASIFTNDLMKRLNFPLYIDYIQASSYEGTSTTGHIIMKKDLSLDITGRKVLIVEDIIDTGLTLDYLTKYFKEKYNPLDIKVCCLIDKQAVRTVDFKPDYAGYILKENKFLIGYGLDYNELLRNIPYIFVPDEEDLKKFDEINSK